MKKMSIAVGPIVALMLTSFSVFAQTQSRDDILKEIQKKRAELDALETRFLSPSEEDRAAYADFLRLPDTGLIRLLPAEKYATTAQQKGSLTISGGGAYYSFFRLTHEYGYGSDIQLAQGWLSTGLAGANYGILTNLGNIPLENVSLESPAVQVLATHTPPNEEPNARIEQRKWGSGTTIEGKKYAERLVIKADSTYLIRSINYSGSDVLVAFRVVRIDDDDSATILWKRLKKYPTPYLDRN